jgi:hypothetical protein
LIATGAGTTFWRDYEGHWTNAPRIYQYASILDLGQENNVAAWFSSMLLGAIAWLAVLCFLLDRRSAERSWLAYGWLLMAAVFLALSFDELGSLHERVPIPGGWAGRALWYLPVVAVLPAYMGAFAYSRLRADPIAVALIALGALTFASVPIQEFFEVEVQRATGGGRPVLHTLMEEGCELLGMLLILTAFVRYVHKYLLRGAAGVDDTLHLVVGLRSLAIWIAVLVGGGLLAGEAAARWLAPDELSGDPRHWFPALASFGAACLSWHAAERAWSTQGLVLGQLAAICLLASALIGGHLNGDEPLLALFAALLAAAWLVGVVVLRSPAWTLGIGLWGTMLLFSFTQLQGPAMLVGAVVSMLILVATLVVIQQGEVRRARVSVGT